MPENNPLTFLQALLTKDFKAPNYKGGKVRDEARPLIITLSRDYGALGEEIARQLSDCLGIPVYDQEILEHVAAKAKADKFLFQPHDEQVDAGISSFLYSLVSGSTATAQSYRRYLYEVVLELTKKDCILVGRGAHLILSNKNVFRLRVVGSKLVCAQRIAQAYDMPLLEAEQKVFEINNKRHQSILSLYSESFENSSLEAAKNFDLTINTDHFSTEGATSVALLAMQQMGFALKARA